MQGMKVLNMHGLKCIHIQMVMQTDLQLSWCLQWVEGTKWERADGGRFCEAERDFLSPCGFSQSDWCACTFWLWTDPNAHPALWQVRDPTRNLLFRGRAWLRFRYSNVVNHLNCVLIWDLQNFLTAGVGSAVLASEGSGSSCWLLGTAEVGGKSCKCPIFFLKPQATVQIRQTWKFIHKTKFSPSDGINYFSLWQIKNRPLSYFDYFGICLIGKNSVLSVILHSQTSLHCHVPLMTKMLIENFDLPSHALWTAEQ